MKQDCGIKSNKIFFKKKGNMNFTFLMFHKKTLRNFWPVHQFMPYEDKVQLQYLAVVIHAQPSLGSTDTHFTSGF